MVSRLDMAPHEPLIDTKRKLILVITGENDSSSMPNRPNKCVSQQLLFRIASSYTGRSPTLEPILRNFCRTSLRFIEREKILWHVIQPKQISRCIRYHRRAVDDFFDTMLEHFV
jgi:hypothetical protein